eukprot:m.67206 g.67206  ORF g.67206 m.67206 type:complete len:76 (+) comp14075_c0_seq17:1807-2034(+)
MAAILANELVPLLESAFKLLRIVGHRGTTASQREAISSDEVMEPIAKHFGSTPKGHLLVRVQLIEGWLLLVYVCP